MLFIDFIISLRLSSFNIIVETKTIMLQIANKEAVIPLTNCTGIILLNKGAPKISAMFVAINGRYIMRPMTMIIFSFLILSIDSIQKLLLKNLCYLYAPKLVLND